ncbi:MAG: sulfatase-like hydrolase/transferase [Candidatus Micrarchaeota archaeon]
MKNIILITIDCLRYDYSEQLVNKIKKTLGNGIVFKNAYSTGPATAFSFTGMLCSKFTIMPDETTNIKFSDGKQIIEYLPNRDCIRKSLVSELKKHDYETYALHNNPYIPYVTSDQDIDHCLDSEQKILAQLLFKKLPVLYKYIHAIWFKIKFLINKFSNYKLTTGLPYLNSEEITKRVKETLKKRTAKPIYLHLHYMDAHGPFSFRKTKQHNATITKEDTITANQIFIKINNGCKKIEESDIGILKKIYENELSQITREIINVIRHLESIGALEDYLLIITSDHGQLFGENGLYDHAYPINDKKDLTKMLCKELLHVPLAIFGLGNKDVEKVVSLVDISPTILDIVGITKPAIWYGKTIITNMEEPAISEVRGLGCNVYAIREGSNTLIYNDGTKEEKLKTIDTKNHKKIHNRLVKKLKMHLDKKKKLFLLSLRYKIKKMEKTLDTTAFKKSNV